jgi:hypothetical protein
LFKTQRIVFETFVVVTPFTLADAITCVSNYTMSIPDTQTVMPCSIQTVTDPLRKTPADSRCHPLCGGRLKEAMEKPKYSKWVNVKGAV